MINDYLIFDGKTFNTVYHNYMGAIKQAYEELYDNWKYNYCYYLRLDSPSLKNFKKQILSEFPIYQTVANGYAVRCDMNIFYTALRKGDIEKAADIIKRKQFMSVKAFADNHDIDYSFALKEIHSIWCIATGNAICYPIPVALENRIAEWVNPSSKTNFCLYYNPDKIRNIGNLDFFDAIYDAYEIALEWALIMCKDRCTLNNNYSELAESEIRIKELLKRWNAGRIHGLTDPSNIL